MKKLIYLGLMLCLLTACGSDDGLDDEAKENAKTFSEIVDEQSDKEEEEATEAPVEETEEVEEASESDEGADLFQQFCDGKIDAEARSYYDDSTWTMSAKDFIFPGQENEDADPTMEVTIEDPVDLDNDGELEYVLNNLYYGSMCFDCKDGKVICFAQGEGTAAYCSYTYYDDAYWIVHSDTTHGGRCTYELTKFNGDLEVVDSFTFGWEDWEEDGEYSYFKDDQSITEDEFNELEEKVFN